MIETPHVTHSPEQLIAAIRLTIPRDRIQQVMGPGIGELMATLATQGIAPAGPWMSHHFRMDPGTFDFEICVPVAAPVAPAGRVTPGILRAVKVARTVYHGGYEGLGAAWGELDAWIAAQRLSPAPDLWECYVVGPESGPDPAAWRTQLNRPLAS
jgi:effector-binding domain-containing protein